MLTGKKHVANDSFIFLQDSALAHYACNNAQLLESETSLILIMSFPQQHGGEPH